MKHTMNRLLQLSLFLIAVSVYCSCSKDDEGPKIKGCMDNTSLNYNEQANADDGSCIYPADKLTGSWKVTEEVSIFNTNTFVTTLQGIVNYNASVTKADKTKINIKTDRAETPVYIYTGTLTINWGENKIEVPGTSVTGAIANENNFTVSFVGGANPTVYLVKQIYTR